MNIYYSEIYYTSSQFGILSESDGFGIRTFTEGLNPEIIENIKKKNLFHYKSGKKQIAGTYDLLSNPEIVYEYPKTYVYFSLNYGDDRYYILMRNVFIGRDYGWYLDPPEESARAGNMFAHILVFDQAIHKTVFSKLDTELFKPVDYTNDSANHELKGLITGIPNFLPIRNISLDFQHPKLQESKTYQQFVLFAYSAFISSKNILVISEESLVSSLIGFLFSCLPSFLIKSLSFISNYQEFNLDPEYNIIFVNEHQLNDSIRQMAGNDWLVCDLSQMDFPIIEESLLINFLRNSFEDADFESINKFCNEVDKIIEEKTENIDWDILYATCQFLYEDQTPLNPEIIIEELKKYKLKENFKRELVSIIQNSFSASLVSKSFHKTVQSLPLIKSLSTSEGFSKALNDIKHTFSIHFFQDKYAQNLIEEAESQNIDISLIYDCLLKESIQDSLPQLIDNLIISKANLAKLVYLSINDIKLTSAIKVIYSITSNKLVSPSFFSSLAKSISHIKYKELIIHSDYFLNTSEKIHKIFFKESIELFIRDQYNNGDTKNYALKILSVLDNDSKYAYSFFSYYMNLVLNHKSKFKHLILLIHDFNQAFEASLIPINQYHSTLYTLFSKLIIEYQPDFRKSLKHALSSFQFTIQTIHTNIKNISVQKDAGFYYGISYFMIESLIIRKYDDLIKIKIPPIWQNSNFFQAQKISKEMLAFLILNLPQFQEKGTKMRPDHVDYLISSFDKIDNNPIFLFQEFVRKWEAESKSNKNLLEIISKDYLTNIWALQKHEGDSAENQSLSNISKENLFSYTEEILRIVGQKDKKCMKNLIEHFHTNSSSKGLQGFIQKRYVGIGTRIMGMLGFRKEKK